ncbi:transporter substrate-binding domain-containing protein [Cerasicoccus maritimus]|uniref:transporter substrate-binding domain-containing protein n=1 Tax=Cerasicoccus maritimus TaxID=490089 RepID=UPI002852C39E|nr:transporter substrate-binding domain-containing protein [Cerasicoccus maritimus]
MRYILLTVCLIIAGVCNLPAQTDTAPDKQKLTIATSEAPPFAFKDEEGQWAGITIELWEAIADKLGYDYTYVENELEASLKILEAGKADLAASAISVTADRAKVIDFTHTYYGASLGIATSYKHKNAWLQLFSQMFTATFLQALFTLILVLLIAGFLVWIFEHKRNPEQFGGSHLHGLGAAFWWSAVTMTTVGYGDKSPNTLGGRVVGLVWMFTSIIIISGLTGAIATALTVGSLSPRVKGMDDLRKVQVGVIQDSVSDGYLKSIGIHPTYFTSVHDGLQAVSDNTVGAFVNDHAIINYWAAKDFAGQIDVLHNKFNPSYLALAMPMDSEHLREFDIAMLEFIQTPAWDAILRKYRAAD